MFDLDDRARKIHRVGVVGRYEAGDLVIDTVFTPDSDESYETAVSHPEYQNGSWIAVEMYRTWNAATEGHERWVQRMTTEPLPDSLRDVHTSVIAKLIDALTADQNWRVWPRKG